MRSALLLLLLSPVASAQVRLAALAAPSSAPVVRASALDFSRTPEQLKLSYDARTARLDAVLASIVALPAGEVRFANTVKAFEQAVADWSDEVNVIGLLTLTSPDPAIREAAAGIEDRATNYGIELSHREDLYLQFKLAAEKGEALDPVDARLLKRTIDDFQDAGFKLPRAQQAKLKEAEERLGALRNKFERNIAAHKDSMSIDDETAAQLPEAFRADLKRGEDGRYAVRVDGPSYTTLLTYAKDGSVRREMERKYLNRAVESNIPVLKEALELRRDIARQLGYEGFPQKEIRNKMAATVENVNAFLARLRESVTPRAKQDFAELLEAKRKDVPEAERIESWDRSYYERVTKESRFGLDPEKIAEYFPVDRVVAGTMDVYQEVLGLKFREVLDGSKWHPEVREIEVSDAKTGRPIGKFYLDLFPRDGKYTHAAVFGITPGRALPDGSYQAPAAAMVANMPKAAPGQPALLQHRDVETYFHEFGHLMHQLLTEARYASMAGTSVARDFVEAPSQMLENFVWERSVIDRLSGHWRDGSKLPQETFDKMVEARHHLSGMFYARQLAYAIGDMFLHTVVPVDPSAAFNRILEEVSLTPTPKDANMVASFGHLLGGYGAGYYGYLWSKVFAQDIYTLFKADGVLSPAVGERYRREILSKGSERPEIDSLRAFLGREPSEDAFMREIRGESSKRDLGGS